jgi:mRNA interferase RelE/StbE
MTWKIEFTANAEKQFSKLDKFIQKQIINYLKSILTKKNPRQSGKPLSRDMKGLWRFRYDAYRIVCQILDDELIVLVLKVAHRKEVYGD